MKLTITIESGNAAFVGEDCAPECARILRNVIRIVDEHAHDGATGKLLDVNGNTIGSYNFSGSDDEDAELDDEAEAEQD